MDLMSAPASRLRRWPKAFLDRHDALALSRQGRLCVVLLVLDAVLILATFATSHEQHWISGISSETIFRLWLMTGIGVALLLLASNWPNWVQDFRRLIAGVPEAPRTTVRIERLRPFVFYPAVYFNLLVIVLLIHATGGLTGSPYTGYLYALLLGAQVFSRYRRQSACYIIAGGFFTFLIFISDVVFPLKTSIQAPRGLIAFITVSSFGVAAALAQVTKPGNPVTVRVVPVPKSAVVYCDSRGVWRYAMYSSSRIVDPIIGGATTWSAAKQGVEVQLALHYQAAEREPVYRWQRANNPTSRTVQIEEPEDVDELLEAEST